MSARYAKDLPSGAKNHIENIAIVGATGTVGKYITEHLLKTGKHTVTAITRESSSIQPPTGVKVAKVDYDEPSSLVKALQGQDALIITMGTRAPKEQSIKLIEAAAEAKVGWIMPNEYCPDLVEQPQLGRDALLLDPILAAQQRIEDLGISSWVGLTSGFWYQYSLVISPWAFGFDIRNKKAVFVDDGRTKQNTSTWPQSGRAVASLFSLPIYPEDASDERPTLSQFRNKECHISSFFLSQQDMLDSILRVTGGEKEEWNVTYEPGRERYQRGMKEMQDGDRMQGFQTCMYTSVLLEKERGDFNAKLDNKKLGLPEEKLDDETKEAVRMVETGWSYY